MSRSGVISVIAASFAAVVLTAAAAAQTPNTPNLIANGGAEAGPASVDGYKPVSSVPGWKRTGAFTVVAYTAGGGFPDAPIAAGIGGQTNFFAGGPDSTASTATQVVDVKKYRTPIAAGKRKATLSGFLGGYANHDDAITVTATFLGAAGERLGVLKIGPVKSSSRKGVTAFLQRSASTLVPKQTRSIQVKLSAVRTHPAYDDGYADNLSLTLAAA